MSNADVPFTDDLARDNPVPGLVHPLDLPLPGAGPVLAVKRFYQNYAKFSGRASRSEYWWVVAAFALAWVVLGGAALATGSATATTNSQGALVPGSGIVPFLVLLGILGVASIVPGIAVTVRRLHDANFPGLLYLVAIVPYIGSLALLVLSALPSKPAGARFDAFRGVYAPGAQSGLLAVDDVYPQSQYPMQQKSPFYSAGPPTV